ncbi:2,3-bisphosphoglycerate-independent phosphoglycerate mutase [Candidatus Dojkabacteria bacterium]|nr:2,3-bisphosphoglycerate-independent phosphoglycerate mutase [Candidatus Dojkabacteria bacterium]
MENKTFKPIVLLILDGVGIAPTNPGNAVTKANAKFLEQAWSSYPHTYLQASEEYVGLPKGVKGNSEVGHMNIGSGTVVYQALPRINRSIDNNQFYKNIELNNAVKHAQKYNSKVHLALCLSDAGVHSTIKHLEPMIQLISKASKDIKVVIHAFTDGRDTPPQSAKTYLNQASVILSKYNQGFIGTITGRYYAMDRNEVWERTQKAYDMLTSLKGNQFNTWQDAIDKAYERNETDEFITPSIINPPSSSLKYTAKVEDNDAFIFMNYRTDRAVQLSRPFVQQEFSEFEREVIPHNVYFVGMVSYAKGIPKHIAFPSDDIKLPLGRIVEQYDLRQLRLAESEKFPHVTYFFNGGRSITFNGEDRIEIPSPSVPTYDKKPEMSAIEITQTFLEKLALNIYDLYIINFANGDMVAHTGNFEATLIAMKVIDKCSETIVRAVQSVGGTTIITADHGNAEELINLQTNEKDTEHSKNPVPFILIPPKMMSLQQRLESGVLADISPTIITLLDIPKPSGITGKSLI